MVAGDRVTDRKVLAQKLFGWIGGRSRAACALTVLVAGVVVLSGCGSDGPPAAGARPASGAVPAPVTVDAGCRNLPASDDVKAAVTKLYSAQYNLVHIVPHPGGFFYGECDGTNYAATAFDLTADATEREQIDHMDPAAVMKYYSQAPGAQWALIGSDQMGSTTTPCTTGTIPAPLATLWNNCRTS
jgi:hypothetical protein